MAHSQSQSDIESTTRVVATGDDTCPVCGATARTQVADDLAPVCADCGVVLSETVRTQVPPRIYSDTSGESPDADWAEIARVRNATEQRIADAFETIETLADQLTLPADVRSDAAELYCDGLRVGTTDGRDTATMVAAAVRHASLKHTIAIPMRRLADAVDVDRRQCQQASSALAADCSLTTPAPDPAAYLSFLGQELNCSTATRDRAADLLQDCAGTPELVGKHPAGIAAAAVYTVASGCTQADVATVAGISTETVRKRASQLETLQTNA